MSFSRAKGVLILLALFVLGALVRSKWFFELTTLYTERSAAQLVGSSKVAFEDVTSLMGLRHRYVTPGIDQVLAPIDLHVIGGRVAIADINLDGWFDPFFTSGHEHKAQHLYLNEQGKAFSEVAAEWGVAGGRNPEVLDVHPLLRKPAPQFAALSATFFDMNADGLPDLYVAGVGCSRVYENQGTRFLDRSQESGLSDCRNAQMGVPADYDADGDLDLYIVRYFGDHPLFDLNRSDVWINSVTNATNGGINTWYRNEGGGRFEDVTSLVGAADPHFSFDAAIGQVTGQPRTQLIVANDFGPDSFYEFDGLKFSVMKVAAPHPDRRLGMGVSISAALSDNTPFVHISNGFHALWRNEGNFLWKHAGGRFNDRALELGTYNCSWAWGSVFADFNNDGNEDLYVANGFVTGRSSQEAGPGAFAEPSNDISFKLGTLLSLPGFVTQESAVSAFLLNDKQIGDLSFAGMQRDCLFLNHQEKFLDIASALPAISRWDGRAVARIDFDNDGDLDIVITTRNQGVHLLRNDFPLNSAWIGFNPSGPVSYWGMRIRVEQVDHAASRQVDGGKSGFLAISDPRLHFGLPDAGAPVRVRARLPSGQEIDLGALPPGRYYRLADLLAPIRGQALEWSGVR